MALEQIAGKTANEIDERFGSANFVKRSARKVFPDHWSFMLGEIALYSFIILLLTGTFLTLWFKPSHDGGRLRRLLRPAARPAHVGGLRVDAGDLLRRPRRPDHPPDPPLGGADLRRRDGRAHVPGVLHRRASASPARSTGSSASSCSPSASSRASPATRSPTTCSPAPACGSPRACCSSLPVVGTYLSFFLFGGEFPGEDIIPRLYTAHVLLIPGIFLALITVHLMLVWYQKHTQYPRPGRTEKNVVGYPFFPVYTAKAGGFFFIIFGVTTLLSAFASINPIWLFGPYNPGEISAGSQPDWYMGFLEGALRLFPNWETASPGLHDPLERPRPGADHPRPAVHADGDLSVPRTLGHRRQPGAPHPRPAAQRADPHRPRRDGPDHLADPAGRRRQRRDRGGLPPLDQHDHLGLPGADLRRAAAGLRRDQADLPRACSAATATWSCTAGRPAASCASRTAR